ncbi:TIGR02253 family HAD-type hydrolase [Candidatus Woesearchaeota archaeon]|nr:TIGR02253 family HAD-type hydrolase [Candidatus Woesearchaeota archaeon]
MIKSVIFDLDNTLIDFMKIKRASVEAAVSSMISAGLRMGKDDATKALFELYDEYGIEYQQIFQKFLEKVHKKVDYRILAAGIVAYRKLQLGLLGPYPSVVPTLIRLKERGFKLAILSDAPRLKAWIRLTEMGLADFFDVVITFDDTGELKPSSVPFKRVLKELDVSPEEALMVGDNPSRDIKGAKNVGMRTVFARYGDTKDIKSSGADFEIDSIDELLAIVKR